MSRPVEISAEEYSRIYRENKEKLVLHSCFTESERGVQMTAWSLKGSDDWCIQWITEEGDVQTYYKRESEFE